MQTTGLDEIAVARAHRISVDDLGSTATLNRIILPQHHRLPNGNRSPQQTQKQSIGFPLGPGYSVEHPMEILKVLLSAQIHNAQLGIHRSQSWDKDGVQQPDLWVLSNTPRIEHCKSCEDRDIFARQGRLDNFS